eukprot:jgi/Botrbrau1/11316/Bobra.0038s0077.1
MSLLDVAIAGGGPGGLATAHALHRALPNLKIKVFEGTGKMTAQGAGVLVNLNGLAALQAIDPAIEQRIVERGSRDALVQIEHTNLLGEPLDGLAGSGLPPTDMKYPSPISEEFRIRYGRNMCFLGWHEIRQALADALPQGTVELGTKVTGYTKEEDETLSVNFEGEREAVRARILVGADGYFSRVREAMLGDGPPTFLDRVTWRTRVPHGPGLPPMTISRYIFPVPTTTTIAKRTATMTTTSINDKDISFNSNNNHDDDNDKDHNPNYNHHSNQETEREDEPIL